MYIYIFSQVRTGKARKVKLTPRISFNLPMCAFRFIVAAAIRQVNDKTLSRGKCICLAAAEPQVKDRQVGLCVCRRKYATGRERRRNWSRESSPAGVPPTGFIII